MNIKPFGDRILVKPIQGKQKLVSGLEIDNSNELKTEGEVIALGDGELASKMFKVGEKVLFKKYSGHEISSGYGDSKEEYLVLYVGTETDISDVVAIFE